MELFGVYDTSDVVQRIGGIDAQRLDYGVNIDRFKFANQKINSNKVKNIQVEVPNKHFYDEPFGDHSNMDSKDVWDKIK